ncbi:MAG: FAD-binding oxidoreductase [Pseudomonadales bacterium]|nr:FAD-binding oxidoreductase [Pseudomonadales bacterium]
MEAFHSELRAIAGETGVLTGEQVRERLSGIWRKDPIQAHAIVRPRTNGEVSRVLELCNLRRQSVVAHGGLTGVVASAVTGPDDLVLSLERMNRIESVDTTNRTMTVQAGTILQRVQERADAEGMLFPLDLGARGSCTVGGNISTNAGGNRVIRYGMTRESVLGLEAVLADGTVVSSMNSMIKNNTGYDLKQLFIGSEGSLGVVTRAVLRLREKPRSRETVLIATRSFDQLPALLKLLDSRLNGTLSAFEVMWADFYALVTSFPAHQSPPLKHGYSHYVLAEALGGDPATDKERMLAALQEAAEEELVADAVLAQNESQRTSMWAVRDDVDQIYQYDPMYTFDVSLRIGAMKDYVDSVEQELLAEFGADRYRKFTFGHMGDGNLHFAIHAGSDDAVHPLIERCVYEPLRAIGGSVSAEHGIGLEKKPYLSISRSDVEIEVMRRLKSALDPNGILNNGKIFDFPQAA